MNVSDIMTKQAVTVRESDSLLAAAELLAAHEFDGLPVVAEDGTLVGLITQENLITKTSHVHIPTLLAFLKAFDLYRKDKKFVKEELDKIRALRVGDVMNQEPPHIHEGEPIDMLMVLLSRIHGVSPVSVVTKTRVLKGVVTRYDLFKMYGAEPVHPAAGSPSAIDGAIDSFLKSFERRFLFISRDRTRAWLLINFAFLVFGILTAIILFW